ncbi:hypothetical protein KIPE111705_15225 [Kibdelosporangium persicum]|uniref:Uncharacterized protein n=1 Tax=Kibdelosporangium persicum TaxID=2698649 RepID=A0ABX2FEH6_9PSEU|nr:hypothetical protein [Kibdelosporangium persicum]NRN69539.1 hypothetical protein [Kibdelosporangium persicum]
MAAPATPRIRLGLIAGGTLHCPASRRLADRYVATPFTDRSAKQSRRFTGTPWQLSQYRGGVHHIAQIRVVQRVLGSAQRATVLALDPESGSGPVPLWRPRGSTGLVDGLPAQHISSSASFAA